MSSTEAKLGPARFDVTAERPLVFVHLVKCAGTSVHEFLVERFGAENISPARELIDFESIEAGFKVYSGHMFVRQWSCTSLKPYFITWLREPVARVLSSFYYFAAMSRLAPNAVDWFSEFRSLSLEDYARGSHPLFRWNVVNHMAHLLGPGPGELIDDEEKLLFLAAESLQKFSYVGVAEDTMRCLYRLAECLGVEPPQRQYEAHTYQQVKNLISMDLKKQFPATAEILSAIEQNNRVDAELYRLAVKRNALLG